MTSFFRTTRAMSSIKKSPVSVLGVCVRVALLLAAAARAFGPAGVVTQTHTSVSSRPQKLTSRSRVVVGGIFDGVKDAFSQDVSILEDDRVTPFDRWLGIDVKSDDADKAKFSVPDDFVDSMDESNYVVARLPKPMGIVFEENDPSTGGVFVASLAENGAAAADGGVRPGDQLVAVGATLCKGADFDTCLEAIQSSDVEKTKLLFFRGGPSSLYGNLGASDEWMDQFMTKQRAEN